MRLDIYANTSRNWWCVQRGWITRCGAGVRASSRSRECDRFTVSLDTAWWERGLRYGYVYAPNYPAVTSFAHMMFLVFGFLSQPREYGREHHFMNRIIMRRPDPSADGPSSVQYLAAGVQCQQTWRVTYQTSLQKT